VSGSQKKTGAVERSVEQWTAERERISVKRSQKLNLTRSGKTFRSHALLYKRL